MHLAAIRYLGLHAEGSARPVRPKGLWLGPSSTSWAAELGQPIGPERYGSATFLHTQYDVCTMIQPGDYVSIKKRKVKSASTVPIFYRSLSLRQSQSDICDDGE